MHLFIVLGTRPEAIKLAPVVLAAREHGGLRVTVCNTGQHADMCASVLGLFEISPDLDLAIMRQQQRLGSLTASALTALSGPLERARPDWLIVQGDTTSAFAAALAAFYQKVPVAHVEAGLRTGDIYSPWPEEMNRKLITGIACLHFAPVASNVGNLRSEGVDPDRILVTGNTGIDALKWLVLRLAGDSKLREHARAILEASGLPRLDSENARVVLITAHRRESFGPGLAAIGEAIATLAESFPDRDFVYPMHPNPQVREAVRGTLGLVRCTNIHLIEPLDYLPFVLLMSRAELVLTDSGGIQEEAPSLGIRTVVMRQVTERSEGLSTGLVRLAGTDRERIVADATDALTNQWRESRIPSDIYGEGTAARRIVAALLARTSRSTGP